MLDKLSEKFLKYIISHNSNNSVSNVYEKYDEIGISPQFIYEICKDLDKCGYITAIFADDEVYDVILRHKGAVYFSYKRAEKIEFYKQLAVSKISDIIVSAIVALITALLVA